MPAKYLNVGGVAELLGGAPAPEPTWDELVDSLNPTVWLKLDDGATATVAADASGNGLDFAYPNGTNASFPVRQLAGLVGGSSKSIRTTVAGNNELWRLASGATIQAALAGTSAGW